MARPKASEARDTRRELLEAALELFAQYGFHGTGLREIARAVGIRESAVYHHFSSKEELFEALLVEAPEDAPAHVRTFVEAPLPDELAPFFARLLEGMLERCATLRERKRFRLLMNDGMRLALEGRISFMDRVGGAARALMLQLMQRLVAEKRLQGDPELLALSFIAPLVMWRQMQELQPQHRFFGDYRAFARAHVQQFLSGAAATARPPSTRETKPIDRSAGARSPARRG